MKFAAVFCVILALFGLSLALKDPKCGPSPESDGGRGLLCRANFSFWSYFPEDNACKMYRGCFDGSNRFSSQEKCEAKCKV